MKVGEKAPDFSLPDQTGKKVSLSDLLKKKCLVLFFYPKDNTPGCTKEACSFRDHYEIFQKAGAEVAGVSSDSVVSHKKFADSFKLPFYLLSDEKGEVRKAYRIKPTLGIIPGRVSFVIDSQGIIRHVFNSQFQPEKHIQEALKVIQKIKSEQL